jgi:hypothetical protein
VGEGNLIVMYRDCPFCGTTHRSPYVDELEATVLTCRDRARPEDRGSIESWIDKDTSPIRCETEALSRAA